MRLCTCKNGLNLYAHVFGGFEPPAGKNRGQLAPGPSRGAVLPAPHYALTGGVAALKAVMPEHRQFPTLISGAA